MSETSYSAEVVGITEAPENRFAGMSAGSMAGIIVKPPIPTVGEAFYAAVLGESGHDTIKHVVTTGESTTFLTTTNSGDQEQRTARLEEIARRIGDYATDPTLVIAALSTPQRRAPDAD